MIHLAIVEDETFYVETLKEYIKRYEQECGREIRVSCFMDGEEIVEKYKGEYDIILMDIQMKFMDGMTAAEKIREMDKEVMILFITNWVQYAVQGYQVDALDYIIKPIEYFAFSQKLERAFDRIRNRKERYLSVPVSGGIRRLDINEIYYVESQSHALIYQTKKGKIETRGNLRELEEKLVPYGFFRSNKGILVNMHYVEGVQDKCCLVCGEALPISRPKRKLFMQALVEYMSEVMKQ